MKLIWLKETGENMKTLLIIAALSLSGCTAADLAAFNAGYYGTGLQQRPVYQQVYTQPSQYDYYRPRPDFKVETKIVDTPYGTVNCTDFGSSVQCY